MPIFGCLEHTRAHIVHLRDFKSFEELFNSQYSNLCAYANKYLENLQDAEEIVQDVFVKLWENRDELQIDTSINAYIFRSVRNASINLLKHRKVRIHYRNQQTETVQAKQENLEEAFFATELENSIREAIDQLPFERKKIFIMSRYEGLKYREIAEKQGVSIKTVEKQMGKALKFLREKLSKYLEIYTVVLIDLLNRNEWY